MAPLRDVLISKIFELKSGIEGNGFDEISVQIAVNDISDLAPDARFSDLYFYPEKDRTVDEIVDEIIKRQEMFNNFGNDYLINYIKQEYENILEDKNAELNKKYNAMSVLQYM